MQRIWLSAGFVLMLTSCAKDSSDIIPNVYVNYRISIQQFQINKNANGVLLVNNQGVAGLIIYRRTDGAYVAYDRCSTVNPTAKCAVVPDETGLGADDVCSGAKFSLFDGSPSKAPATRSLKSYQVRLTSFEIVVQN
jgi:hypothetical protein